MAAYLREHPEKAARFAEAAEQLDQRRAAAGRGDDLRERSRRFVELMDASGVPERHAKKAGLLSPIAHDVPADNAKVLPWRRAVENAIACLQAGAIVILAGPRGTGKTQAAVECIRAFCREGKACRYYRSRRQWAGYYREIYEAEAPDLLVVDECRFDDSEAISRILDELVDARYGAGRPTLLVYPDNEKPWNEHTVPVSRAREGGAILWFGWGSFRSQPPHVPA